MKKLFTTMLTILASGAAFALPVGNPSEASLLFDGICWEGHCGDMCDPSLNWCDAFSVRIGFYGDYVFNRNLEVYTLPGSSDSNADYLHSRLFTNAGYIALNLWDRADIFATFGATAIRFDGNSSTFALFPFNYAPAGIDPILSAILGGQVFVETKSAFSWSIGGRATLWECGCTHMGIEGQYFSTRPDLKFVSMINTVSTDGEGFTSGLIMSNSLLTSHYYEGQIGIGISHHIPPFVPYIAIKWSTAKLLLDNAKVGLPFTPVGQGDTQSGLYPILADARSAKQWGYAIGVSIIGSDKAALTGEARFADEAAAYINGQFRF